MKSRFVCVFMVLLLMLSVAAICAPQGKGKAGASGKMGFGADRPKMGSEVRVKAFCRSLELNEAACGRVGEIVKSYQESMAAVIKDKATTPEQKRSSAQALRSKAESDIMALLTPQQKEKAEKEKLIMRLLNPVRGGQGWEWALDQINLDQNQKTQIQAILSETREASRKIRNDSSLTQEQKQQKLLEIHKQSQDRIMGVLTPEQREKLKQIQENARERMRRGPAGDKQERFRKRAIEGGSGGGQI